jgi:hypothetical protein
LSLTQASPSSLLPAIKLPASHVLPVFLGMGWRENRETEGQRDRGDKYLLRKKEEMSAL